MIWGVDVLSRTSVCFFYISCIGFLQSWPYTSTAEFDVINLALAFPAPTFVAPPSGVLVVSARKTGVVSRGS